MANKVNVTIDANVSGYVQGVDAATQSAKAYETESKKVSDAQVNLMKELKAAKREVQNLAAGFAQLSTAEKNSSFGKEMARQLEQAKQKAAEFIDLQGDLSQELKNRASDTRVFDTMADGLSGLASTMSAVTGVVGIFTDDTEKMTKAITYFTTAESIASAAIKVKNLLQKQSSLMLGVAAVQHKALTVAENLDTAAKSKNTIATGAATVAQKAFNMVAKSNPYVLLATAVIGVTTALWAFASKSEDAKKEQEKLKVQLDKSKQAAEDYAKAVGDSYSKQIYTYNKLKTEYKALKSDMEKTEFLKKYKTELDKVAKSVDTIVEADKFFNADSKTVIKSFQLRAQAAAAAALAQEKYAEAMRLNQLSTSSGLRGSYISNELANKLPKELKEKLIPQTKQITETFQSANNTIGSNIQTITRTIITGYKVAENASDEYLTKLAANGLRASKLAKQAAKSAAEADKLIKEEFNKIQEADKLNKIGGDTKTQKTNTPKKDDKKDEIKNIEDAKKKIDELIQRYNALKSLIDDQKFTNESALNKAKTQLSEYTKQINDISKKWGISTEDRKSIEEAISEYDSLISKYNTLLDYVNKGRIAPESMSEATEQLNEYTQKLNELAETYGIVYTNEDKWANSKYNQLTKKLEEIEDQLSHDDSLTVETRIKLISQANDIQIQLDEISNKDQLSIPAVIEPKYIMKGSDEDLRMSLANAENQINQIISDYNTGIIKSHKDAVDKVNDINKKLEEIGLKPIVVEINTKFDEGFDKLINGYNQFDGFISGIDGCVNAIDRLKNANENGLSGWEQFITVMSLVSSIIDTVQSGMQVFNTIQELLNTTTAATNSLKVTEATERGANATAMGTESATLGTLAGTESAAIAPTIALATATKKLAAANIWLAHSEIPFAGPVAAGAAVTVMEGQLAALTAFANGGIVKGNSFSGDRMLARVNSGEMILNQQQQRNLFNAIDQNKISGKNSVVVTGDIKLKGTDLYVALRNFNNITNKLL